MTVNACDSGVLIYIFIMIRGKFNRVICRGSAYIAVTGKVFEDITL